MDNSPQLPEDDPPQPKKQKLRLSTIKRRIIEFRGNVCRIADSFGRDRQTIYNYIKRYPQLEPLLAEAREIRLDRAEGSLDDAVDRGEGWAVALILKTIGKKRGYGETLGVTGGVDEVTGAPLPISIVLPDNGRQSKTERQRTGAEAPESIAGGEGDRPATGTADENP